MVSGIKHVSPLSVVVSRDEDTGRLSFEVTFLYRTVPMAFNIAIGYYDALLAEGPLSGYPYPVMSDSDLVNRVKAIDLSDLDGRL